MKEKLNYKENKPIYYFCKQCSCSLIFYLDIDNLKISYSCKCSKDKKEISFKDLENFILEEKDISTRLTCQKCYEKYCFFCDKHKENICLKCDKDEDKHKNELLDNLESNFIYYKLLNLLNFALPKKSDKENSNLFEIKNLIKNIILNYINYPTYGLYKTINNFTQKFREYSKNLDKKDNKNYFKKLIDIYKKKRELYELNKELYAFVDRIILFRQKFFDLDKLNDFENMTDLFLMHNCIIDIKPFLNAKFKNLQFLSLERNKLNDDNIIIIENLDFKELISLNLKDNNFTKYELLLAIGGSFKKLEILDISFNILRINNKNKKKNNKWKNLDEIVNELNKLNFKNIKLLSATNGVFTQKTAEKIIPAIYTKNS